MRVRSRRAARAWGGAVNSSCACRSSQARRASRPSSLRSPERARDQALIAQSLRTGREAFGGSPPLQLVDVAKQRCIGPQGRQLLEEQRELALLAQNRRREVLD